MVANRLPLDFKKFLKTYKTLDLPLGYWNPVAVTERQFESCRGHFILHLNKKQKSGIDIYYKRHSISFLLFKIKPTKKLALHLL